MVFLNSKKGISVISTGKRTSPNTGVMFTNNKMTSDRSPSLTGEVDVGGKMFAIAGWWKEPKKAGSTAGKFLSLKISEPRAAR